MTASPAPGTLRLVRGQANPCGASAAEVFLFEGSAVAGVIERVEQAPDVVLPPRRLFAPAQPSRLKILHINDLHGHICRFTTHGEIPVFSKIAGHIGELRGRLRPRPDAALLAMSAGDDLVGSVFDELVGDSAETFQVHVGYRLYSAAGIDVAALGNHDFDMGPAVLAEAIRRDARFPILSANLIASHQGLAGLVHPAALFVVKGMRVGVIGLSTAGEVGEQWRNEFSLVNPVQVAHNLLPALRPLCDVLIILSHLGYSLANSTMVRYAGDVELARSLPAGGAHLIVGGHTHSVLNEQGLAPKNVVNDIPIVQAGTLGEFIGEVNITLRGAPAVSNARLTRTELLPTDEEFERTYVQPLKELVDPLLAKPLGRTADCQDLSTEHVRNDLAAGESALANFVADALAARCRARGHAVDFAFIDATCLRTGIPVDGVVTFGQWFNVMPFADTIRLCWLTGEQLADLLQDNAYRIDRLGEPHIERGFLHFSREVRYSIELRDRRVEARVADITVAGKPLEDCVERAFLVACTSFVREPAAAWEKLAARLYQIPIFDIHRLSYLETGLFLRREIVQYIRDQGGVTAEAGARGDGRLSLVLPREEPEISMNERGLIP